MIATAGPRLFLAALHSGVTAFVARLKHQRVPIDDLGYLRAARAVGELSKLAPDWNSHRADRISDQSRAWATELLIALDKLNRALGCRIPAPAVTPTPDGGVQLAWSVPSPEGELEVEAILLEKGGELYVGLAEEAGFQQQARIDDIETVAQQIGRTLKPHFVG